MKGGVIGIDPGSHCGWAVVSEIGSRIASGTWDCSVRRGEGAGFRYVRFERAVREILAAFPHATVAYEEVRRHMGTDAAHVYGALVGHLQRVCEELERPYVPIPVGTVKKHATGKGNADKDAMIGAALQRWGHACAKSDEADALFIASAAAAGLA